MVSQAGGVAPVDAGVAGSSGGEDARGAASSAVGAGDAAAPVAGGGVDGDVPGRGLLLSPVLPSAVAKINRNLCNIFQQVLI